MDATSQSDMYWRIQSANEDMRLGFSMSGLPSATGTANSPFDSMQHARLSPSILDPNSFSSNFILPRFAAGGPGGAFGYDLAIAEPEREYTKTNNINHNEYAPISRSPSFGSAFRSPAPEPAQSFVPEPTPVPSTSAGLTPSGPVYAPYGSSIVSINPDPSYKNKLLSAGQPASSTYVASTFDPVALNLPVPPPPGTSTNFAGLYSASGFDLLSVLARVIARPNPTIQIGPVDSSCAFLVVDARKWDMPIVFASDKFAEMTGYRSDEIIGKNCRFLQSPDGITSQGAPRKYTDGAAAWHMRTHINSGKESQSSLINYKKGGTPFINLVTIIPIAWDTEEVAYYVGFQCDLVAQPAAILDRMKDGSYVVNYSLLTNNSIVPKTVSMSAVEQSDSTFSNSAQIEDSWSDEKTTVQAPEKTIRVRDTKNEELESVAEDQVVDLLESLESNGIGAFKDESDKKKLNKVFLDNSDDFIHVLSLKGSLLYCSPSAARVLEYEPSELVGKTLQALCHPSDVIPVMRELKDSGSVAHPTVSLLYRIRRKHSGYIWIEASGKLHIEPGKGRKCVILVGRPREVYKMSWNEVRRAGGVGESEFWTKLSPEGMVLSATSSVQNVLGFSMGEMVGTSLFQLVKPEFVKQIREALLQCAQGKAVSVRYKTKTRRGYVEVVTKFYPREVDTEDDIPSTNTTPTHVSIIAQTNELNSEERKNRSHFSHQVPSYLNATDACSPSSDGSGSPASSGLGQSSNHGGHGGFKSLQHPSLISDNVFDELDTTRCTSWQYELHQLQISNKKLRDEMEHLKKLQLKKKQKRTSDFAGLSYSRGSSAKLPHLLPQQASASCNQCGINNLASGRTLCDGCVLSNSFEQQEDPAFSPMSVEDSASPVAWR